MRKSNENPIEDWEKEEYFSKKIYVLDKCLYTLGTAQSKDGSSNYYRIRLSNFTIEVLYFIKGPEQSFRVIKVVNCDDKEVIITLNTDIISSGAEFKKALQRLGNFIFSGTGSHLTQLLELLFKGEKAAVDLNILGQHHHDNFFAFSNGILKEGKFYPADKYGIVALGKKYFHICFANTIANTNPDAEADKQLENMARFRYQESQVTFEEWTKKFVDTFGDNGIIALVFTTGTLFRDVIFAELGFFPHLHAFGPPQTGKTTVLTSCARLMGEPQPPISLGGISTTKAMMRKLEQVRNGLVIFEEYLNSIDPKKVQALKNIYDGIGYENAAFSNDSRTKTFKVLSSVMMAGQDLPTADHALFTRCILLSYMNKKFNHQAFQDLKELETRGLSGVLTELLNLRQEFKMYFHDRFRKHFANLNNEFKGYPDRLLKNYAYLLAVANTMVLNLEGVPFSMESFSKLVKQNMKEQNLLLNGTDEVQNFFDQVEYLIRNRKITSEVDFITSGNGEVVYLYMPTIYPEYREAAARQRINVLDKHTLTNYIKADKALFIKHDNAKFPVRGMCGSIIDYNQKTCLHLNRKVLIEKYQLDLYLNTNAGEEKK